MAIRYATGLDNFTPNTSNDIFTLVASAAVTASVLDVMIGGMGTSSVAQSTKLARPMTVGATPANTMLMPVAGSGPTPTVTVATGWSSQPAGLIPLLFLPCNANGGIVRWLAAPGEEITASISGNISLRPSVGTTAETASMVIDQL